MNFTASMCKAKVYVPNMGHGRDGLLAWIDQVQALEIGNTPDLTEAELAEIKTDMALMKTWLEGLGQ